MQTLKKLLGSAILLPLLLVSCILDEGNPNLAGDWNCKETSEIYMKSSLGTSIFTVTFERDAVNLDKYYVHNIYKLGENVTVAVIKEGYTITMPKQTVNGFVFEGTGLLNETYDLLNLSYTADDGGGEVDHVTAEMTR